MRTPHMGLICVISVVLGVVEPGLLICVDKNDCSKGYTCIEGKCTECLMCNLLYRKGSSCTTDFRECGDCLEGYEEISVTDFSSTIKPCKPMKRNVKFKECTSHTHCPPDNYCSEDSCVQCFDCAVVNRLPPDDSCAKGLTECGSCINGFSEVAITADTNYTRCEMPSFVIQPAVVNFILGASLIFFLASLLLFYFLLIRIRKSRSMHKIASEFQTLPSAPPLQDMDVQQTVFKCPISSVLTPAYSHALFEREQRQQALVFKQPDALYYTMEGEGEDNEPIRGSNSCTQLASCSGSVQQQQQQPPYLSLATMPRLDGSQEHDSTDSVVPPTSEINIDSTDTVNGDSIAPERN